MPLREKRVRALLGPTNTGKTHRAIEAMLRHRSGMFGLPLRLLAREVYERVIRATAPDQVALITGEEKIVPPSPRYWICTVEAMPVDQRVAFVGIDEVQLAEDRQRGHVFTDRILHCRGLEETVFMGSDRMLWLLRKLVPEVEVERAPRLSVLSLAGPHTLQGLPERSAVVTFSAAKVYELAERLKGAHGGAAVVLGALSPRTRNAQVELYQSGKVKHLVATDAIGMGLNLDLKHVALASLTKFDGRGNRPLTSAEIGQIAGRAGRYRTDGTFGALRPLELPEEVVEAVTTHQFAPIRRVFWRNTDLDFSSIDALSASLEREPPLPSLIPVQHLDDQHALVVLGRDEALRSAARDPASVRRLWDVCQVPDFRKTLTDAHLRLLRDLAQHLLIRGQLPESWIEDRIGRLDRTDGDIETLMSRLAWIRTWTYITYRADWVDDRKGWQERTRAIEDRLSDALHLALTERFVDRFQHLRGAGLGTVAIEPGGRVTLGGGEVGQLQGLDFVTELRIPGGVRQAVEQALAERVTQLDEQDDSQFDLDPSHQICWQGGVLADLQQGPALLEPKVRLRRLEFLAGPVKDRVRARLERWVESTIDGLVGPMRRPTSSAPLRGLLYDLELGMGSIDRERVDAQLSQLDDEDRRQLAKRGVRVGVHVLYLPSSLKPRATAVRARLWSVHAGISPSLPAPPASSTAVRATSPDAFWAAIGYPVVGGIAVRADTLEAAGAELRRIARGGPFELPEAVVSRLAIGVDGAASFVEGLGFVHHQGRFRRPSKARARRR